MQTDIVELVALCEDFVNILKLEVRQRVEESQMSLTNDLNHHVTWIVEKVVQYFKELLVQKDIKLIILSAELLQLLFCFCIA